MNIFAIFHKAQPEPETVEMSYARIANKITPIFYSETRKVYTDEYGFQFGFFYTSLEDYQSGENSVMVYETDVMPADYVMARSALIESGHIII